MVRLPFLLWELFSDYYDGIDFKVSRISFTISLVDVFLLSVIEITDDSQCSYDKLHSLVMFAETLLIRRIKRISGYIWRGVLTSKMMLLATRRFHIWK